MDTGGVKAIYDSEDRTEYEAGRWASSPVAKAGFVLTREAIERYVVPRLGAVREYLELGPGPGTWTRVLLPHLADARIHLVDISDEMLSAAKKSLADRQGIAYTRSDFLAFAPERAYDVFFSSRAVEYFPEKRPVMERIGASLAKGGRAFIVTKMPHYRRMRILGKSTTSFHRNQSSPREFIEAGERAGLRVVDVRPVFVVVPGLRSAVLDLLATRILRLLPWNPLTAALSESYLLVLEKV